MIKHVSLFFLLFASLTLNAQSHLPRSFNKSFVQQKLGQKYQIDGFVKPTFLQADFNGDGVQDIAVLVDEKKTKKKGVLLMHGGSNEYFIFGAGIKFGNGSDNFKWAGGWKLYRSRTAYETLFNKEGDMLGGKKIKLTNPAFYIYDLEESQPNSGGIIYWGGTKYICIHQGE